MTTATATASLAPHLNIVPEESSGGGTGAGSLTPVAGPGGIIVGREFDLETTRLPPPTSRASTSARPRPVSMPPQSFNTAITNNNNSTPTPTPTTEKEKQPNLFMVEPDNNTTRPSRHREGGSSSSKPSRTTNRILGDYTLSKTLGAGSMGKVKLATHNITGEKVMSSL
jgi:serine/threonine protein kinase KIN1/2